MLMISDVRKKFHTELGTVKEIFNGFNLEIEKGDFLTIIGSNGAGKTTLLDTITGNVVPDGGKIVVNGKDITNLPRYMRCDFISKVYQNPAMGTAPSMTVYENLSMADNKGKVFGLTMGLNKKRKTHYRRLLKELDLGIEDQMDTNVGSLSGGQRQCLALIMSTLNKPEVLLLDEHTAALDPKTSKIIMEKTKEIVEKNNITTLMITHNLQDAINYGNRLIMLHEGKILLDINGEEKKNLTTEKLLHVFNTKDAGLRDSEVFAV
jgi:putative ABC transport system ATP-binding protein